MDSLDPVSEEAPPANSGRPTGVGLCLSGGGYRAMLFHCGTLIRLHETGMLFDVQRISSVSGGSITSAKLALAWPHIIANAGDITLLYKHVIDPIRAMASKTIDVWAGIKGILLPGTISQAIAKAYDKHLYGGATLARLPAAPEFTLCATNLQTTALLRFNFYGVTDWHLGHIPCDSLALAQAVTASSAFPPFLSPCRIDLRKWTPMQLPGADLSVPPYTTRVVASDGGVYDNLGLETIWKRCETILVSDAGAKIEPKPRPHTDWVLGLKRASEIIDDQVRNLRKRELMDAYKAGRRKGAYWGIRANIDKYQLPDALDCPWAKTLRLAAVPTRLASLPDLLQRRLINWGYAVCDAGLRRHVDDSLRPNPAFPYPQVGIG
jgi:NTE family protein